MASRREFLKAVGMTGAGAAWFGGVAPFDVLSRIARGTGGAARRQAEGAAADYTLRIGASAIEIAPKHIVSAVTYNGQFPGPLLRFKEGREVTVDIHNDTTHQSNCTGMGRWFRRTWTDRQKKAHRTFRRAG